VLLPASNAQQGMMTTCKAAAPDADEEEGPQRRAVPRMEGNVSAPASMSTSAHNTTLFAEERSTIIPEGIETRP